MWAFAAGSSANGKARSTSGLMRPSAMAGRRLATNRGTPAARCSALRSVWETPQSVSRFMCRAWLSISAGSVSST